MSSSNVSQSDEIFLAAQAKKDPNFDPFTNQARFYECNPTAPPPKDDNPGIILFNPTNALSTSSEALGVWLLNGHAWKIYRTGAKNVEKKRKAIQDDIDAAKTAGLPVGNPQVKVGLIWTDERSVKRWEAGLSVLTEEYTKDKWTFWSAQKSAGVANFKKLIESIKDKPTVQTIKNTFDIAHDFKLTDPQGFINASDHSSPIAFIDIHKGTNATKVDELLEIVKKHLAELK